MPKAETFEYYDKYEAEQRVHSFTYVFYRATYLQSHFQDLGI